MGVDVVRGGPFFRRSAKVQSPVHSSVPAPVCRMPSPSVAPRAGGAGAAASAPEIFGVRVEADESSALAEQIVAWALEGRGRVVDLASVHTVMEARDGAEFRRALQGMDRVVAEGIPLVWLLRRRGLSRAQRVGSPELLDAACAAAAKAGVPVGFLGGRPEVLARMVNVLQWRHPSLVVVERVARPVAEVDPALDREQVARMAASGAGIVFVGLGCPRQERWMAAQGGRIPAVLVGVGSAFDFHAGMLRQGPVWLQRLGLEWVARLAQQPRRLWKRYLWHNPRFLWAVLWRR